VPACYAVSPENPLAKIIAASIVCWTPHGPSYQVSCISAFSTLLLHLSTLRAAIYSPSDRPALLYFSRVAHLKTMCAIHYIVFFSCPTLSRSDLYALLRNQAVSDWLSAKDVFLSDESGGLGLLFDALRSPLAISRNMRIILVMIILFESLESSKVTGTLT
jgi:hypothetical protein